jgi:hypothetical protein
MDNELMSFAINREQTLSAYLDSVKFDVGSRTPLWLIELFAWLPLVVASWANLKAASASCGGKAWTASRT